MNPNNRPDRKRGMTPCYRGRMDAGWILFNHLANRPDDELDLLGASLVIAEPEYPQLDIGHYVAVVDGMARAVQARVALAKAASDGAQRGLDVVRAVNTLLFEELGYRGNHEDYYDPRNSFVNEVLERRTGIPITMSLLVMEVTRRAGVPLQGVSFPGHFLVKYDTPGGDLLFDPFHGGVALSRADLEERLERAFGRKTTLSPSHLAGASRRQILTRILNNLRGIYQRRGDAGRERAALERIAILNPAEDVPPNDPAPRAPN